MAHVKNLGKENIVFFLNRPESSPNGMYFTQGGITYPSPEYCFIRTPRSGIFWGGVYVFEYIISGKGYIETDGQIYTVSAGDTVFLNSLRDITYYADSEDPYKKIWVNFVGKLSKGMVDGLSLDKNVYIFKYHSEPLIKEIHGLHTGMGVANRFDSYDRMASIVFKLLLEVKASVRETTQSDSGLTAAERVKEFIDGLAIPNINLDDISVQFGFNKNYLIHSFKRRYGIPPNQYIISKKIESAKRMLMEKDTTITEVSNALNYSSTQHFSKSFRLVAGVSPAAYKKMFHDGGGTKNM